MFRNLVNSIDTLMKIPQNVSVQVRYRYFADKKPLVRRWGYEDKLAWTGPLPRLNTGVRLPKPEYRPKLPWTEKKAIFGQNDYIDILGDQKVHPVMISYNVPPWLRGFYGNEYQVALRKRQFFGRRMAAMAPSAYNDLRKRIKYLHKFLNRHKPQNRMPKDYQRYMTRNG